MKILVAGDISGQFDSIFERVGKLNKSHGPFDALLCCGEFFAPDEDHRDDSDDEHGENNPDEAAAAAPATNSLREYTNGNKRVPIPTYFVCGKNWHKVDQTDSFKTICHNLTFLGSRGIVDLGGLRVAYLSGWFPKTAANAMEMKDASALIAEHSHQKLVDVLLTVQWPLGVEVGGVQTSIDVHACSSGVVAHVARAIHPRYIFSGVARAYYERQPYVTTVETTKMTTRFLSIGPPKPLYALNIKPVADMGEEERAAPPPNATTSPFSTVAVTSGGVPNAKLQMNAARAQMMMQQATTSADPASFRWNMEQNKRGPGGGGGGGGDGKRARTNDGGGARGPPPPPSACWFCLASPEVEKHLITNIATHAYLALAKGGIDMWNVLIIPIEHLPSSYSAPKDVADEINRYKGALRKMFATDGNEMVCFERNTFTRGAKHAHIQVLPIPPALATKARAVVMDEAVKFGLEMTPAGTGDAWKQQVSSAEQEYFTFELPDGEVLLHLVPRGGRFPLQFGRQAMCAIRECPEKVDWKVCVGSKEEEGGWANTFKAKFAPYDFSDE